MHFAADAVLILHLLFIVFTATGALLVLRWPQLMWLHLPCLAWGVLIEITGWVCPLTPLEIQLRLAAGDSGYRGDFIAHYLMPLIYPAQLTRAVQIGLGLTLLAVNVVPYVLLVRRHRTVHGTKKDERR